MSKGGYIWIYIGFCWVLVHFFGDGRGWWVYFGCWMVVVGGGEYILAGGGW